MNPWIFQRLLVIAMSLTLAFLAAVTWWANDTSCCHARNLVPMGLAWAFLVVLLVRYRRDPRYWGAWLGFLLPACGLTLYLHLGYALDWSGMRSAARTPALLFRFLPYYTLFAGGIGAAIGWIIGRNARG